jgi:transposase
MNDTLFPLPPLGDVPADSRPAEPRVLRPNRTQLELRPADLDGLLPADHRARVVWDFVAGSDLGPFYAQIKAVESHAGRPAIDPAILMTLWLYATLEGVGSARALARLCEAHDAYRWICGGVSVNYHTLAEFRVAHGELLDHVLTTSVATLMAEGLVSLQRVAQDGVRVRAHAAGKSFRRAARLRALLDAATAQVQALKQELHDDPAATARRTTAARQRAAVERQARVARALARLPELAARRRKARVDGPPRVSTTDPDAQVMKMADGGFRPAFNSQFSTATDSQVIVGVSVGNSGTDLGQLKPMVDQLWHRYGRRPAQLLVDGGYVALDDLRALAPPELGCEVYAPPKRGRGHARPADRRARERDLTAAWRARMATPAAHAVYRQRAATAECVNALARNRGLRQFAVRGLRKAKATLLWFALAHNVLRAAALRPRAFAPA